MASFIIRALPTTLTCCKLISGVIATKCAFDGQFDWALTFIVIGAVFDFFDGFAARLLHVSSPIGKELDSLADVVTFGVAPSAIVYMFLNGINVIASPFNNLLPYVAFLIAAFSALRLAKFNLDERQTTSFIGLPTPANALFWGALILGINHWGAERLMPAGYYLILLLIFIFSGLLVSEIPMFALKFKHFRWKGNAIRYGFIFSAIICIILFQIAGISLLIVWYILLSILTQKK